jgi:hypothetical protein
MVTRNGNNIFRIAAEFFDLNPGDERLMDYSTKEVHDDR